MTKNQSSFHLPTGVSVRKERLSNGWGYVFRHAQLGDLGCIVLHGRADGRTHIVCELAGDTADPMTEERAAIFKPLAKELARQMDLATGGSSEDRWDGLLPQPAESPTKRIATELIQCETCGLPVALLIFAEDTIEHGGLEDYARLMYPQVAELNVPTWVIGSPLGSAPPPERPADILKIWPQRQPICQLRPDEFNPILETLMTTHCR